MEENNPDRAKCSDDYHKSVEIINYYNSMIIIQKVCSKCKKELSKKVIYVDYP